MQKITKIKWAVKREDMILIETKKNNFALQRSSSPQAHYHFHTYNVSNSLSLTPTSTRRNGEKHTH